MEKIKYKFNNIINVTKEKGKQIILNVKIKNKFKDDNELFILYKKDNLLSINLYGYFKNDKIVILGNHDIKINNIIIRNKTNKAFFVKAINTTQVNVEYDGKTYIKDGMEIKIDDNVKEVKVIRAKEKYYLYEND